MRFPVTETALIVSPWVLIIIMVIHIAIITVTAILMPEKTTVLALGLPRS
ncbi:hypothetical protein N9W89_03845 [Hellea sp.]|nr:hypothetical protein [Hellea sp.]